jgi:16S rRNA (cytosine967-C5)-methyltransferase
VTPAARLQSAIEILDLIIQATRDNGPAADTVLSNWFKTRRYAGSKDRRAVRDLIYRAIRTYGEAPPSGRAAMLGLADLRDLFDGSTYGPAPIMADEAAPASSLLPGWLADMIPADEQAALLGRAAFDLRVNRLKADRDAVLPMFKNAAPIPGTESGLRLEENIALGAMPATRGLVEVQDAGSQLVVAACQVKPGMTVIDLCAGAGGKTLALAADMGAEGPLFACDTDRARLSRLSVRASEAGATNIQTRLLNPMREAEMLDDLGGGGDTVLVDAPCSGAGTWRRNPELRWRITPQRLAATITLQARLLDIAATLVRPGGALVYAVCSLIDQEGVDQITAFLARHSGWTAETAGIEPGRPHGDGTILTPSVDGTDGFFVARMSKTG